MTEYQNEPVALDHSEITLHSNKIIWKKEDNSALDHSEITLHSNAPIGGKKPSTALDHSEITLHSNKYNSDILQDRRFRPLWNYTTLKLFDPQDFLIAALDHSEITLHSNLNRRAPMSGRLL